MLILITFILLLIGVALTYNIYSIFRPFMENLGNIQHYNIAYYGAISSIERAELVLRYHTAGFEGSGGWFGTNNIGPSSDGKISNFGLLSKGDNGILREIKSRISGYLLPEPGKGNIDYDLRRTGNQYGGSSSGFNKLAYNMSEEFLLFYDKSRENNDVNNSTLNAIYSGYNDSDITNIKPNSIDVILRLPPKIAKYLGNGSTLDSLAENIDLDEDGIPNDVIVNRSLFGKDSSNNDFTILPTIDVDYDTQSVNDGDTAIRENVINKCTDTNTCPNIIFDDGSSSISGPKNPVQNKNQPTYHNIIPSDSPFSGENFQNIFQNGSKLHLKFSIVNLMKDDNDNIFPFLEYKLKFNGVSTISDRFFHIDGIGKVGDYKVIIHIEKPVIKSTAASDFTILF